MGLTPFALIYGVGVPVLEAIGGTLVNLADLVGLGGPGGPGGLGGDLAP